MESSDDGSMPAVRCVRKPQKLIDQVSSRMRRLGMAIRSEQAYTGWIRRFILANGKRHPKDMGQGEIEAFLTGLAVQGKVAPSTQNQALAALLFLYREVLGIDRNGVRDTF
jgi:hypothetical protein